MARQHSEDEVELGAHLLDLFVDDQRAVAGVEAVELHRVAPAASLLVFPDGRHSAWLAGRRGHRAIGVVYQPSAERRGDWVWRYLAE